MVHHSVADIPKNGQTPAHEFLKKNTLARVHVAGNDYISNLSIDYGLSIFTIIGTRFRNVATNIWTNLHDIIQRPLLFACSLPPNTQGS